MNDDDTTPLTGDENVRWYAHIIQGCALQADTPEMCARTLVALRDTIADLKDTQHELEQVFVGMLDGARELSVEGVGTFEVRRSKSRTQWQHDELGAVVMARLADEPTLMYDDDGELLPPHERYSRWFRRLRECVGISYWKKGGCSPIGIDIDEFSHVESGSLSVQLPSRS